MTLLAFISADDAWVMTAGVFCAVSCALLGCYLVLRRMSLLGDAITHAILPGLALAFIITNSRNILPMMIGALAVGLLTAFLTQALSRWAKVPEDSSLGVVFTSLFALGVLMITYVADDVDLDPSCVLYGDIGATPSFPLIIGNWEAPVPRQVAILGFVLAVNLLAFTLFYKELKIVAFDPLLAVSMGIPATAVHYGLMTLVAGTAVASFESVGSILVVAMFIAPAATAYLLADRLGIMLLLAALLGASAAIIGYLFAAYGVDSPPAAMMAVVTGVQFALAVFLAPRYGIISKALHRGAHKTVRVSA